MRNPLRHRRPPLAFLPLLAVAAGWTPSGPQPLGCDAPVVLRSVAAGLHFEGEVPEGYRPGESGLRNPATGDEIPIEVEGAGEGAAVLRAEGTRVEMTGIRRTGETDDGWRCAAEFTMQRDERTVEGEAEYAVTVSGLDFSVTGRFVVDEVEIRF